MKKYFLVKIKYEKTVEDGKIVKVSEQYLIDALSFTEAEARIIEEMKTFISGEFQITAITPQKVNEIFYNEYAERWFKAKVNFIALDEYSGLEKITSVNMLIQADGIAEAREGLLEGMKGSMADYEIASISDTKIIEVFNYKAE